MSYDYTLFIAIGILIGLSLVLTYLSEEKISLEIILIYMTIIDAFLVSTGNLPLWTLIMFLLITVGATIVKVDRNRNKGSE